MTKTKKVKSAGRFGTGYGKKPKEIFINVEIKQRKKQICPFCNKPAAKRKSRGIWECKKCGKNFASNVYTLTK